MNKNQSTLVSFVPRTAPVQWSKRVKPINGQQYYRNNTNQWIPDEHPRSLHASSLFFDNTESSSNDHFTAMSRTREEGGIESRDTRPLAHLAASEHPFQFQNSNAKDVHNQQKRRGTKAWLIFSGIWHTVVSLTILLISIHLLMIAPETSTTTTDQSQLNQTNSSVTIKQPYICSGISPYTLWTLFFTVGLTMNINTSNCSFNSTPLYFTSLAGTSDHWNVGGYGAIYNPTKNSFLIFTQPLTAYSNTIMLNYSQVYGWDINWFGILE